MCERCWSLILCVKKFGGFSWADMLHRKKIFLSHKTPHTCGAINQWKWDTLSHPQPFVTTCVHHSNITEMDLTRHILYIFKHFMYHTKSKRNQNHPVDSQHWFKNREYPLNYAYVYVWVLLMLGLGVPTLLNKFVRVPLILGLRVPT